jgi:hypothetical protein
MMPPLPLLVVLLIAAERAPWQKGRRERKLILAKKTLNPTSVSALTVYRSIGGGARTRRNAHIQEPLEKQPIVLVVAISNRGRERERIEVNRHLLPVEHDRKRTLHM